MAAFEYVAIDNRGKNKKGIIEGDTARQVRAQLREQGLMPVDVTPSVKKLKQSSTGGVSWFYRGRKISASDLALFTRQLATLVESGLPLEESLLAVAEQTEKAHIKSVVMAVRTKVTEGYGLAESMAEFPNIFDNLFRAMVAAGEKSGHLDKVLERLADYTEQREKTQSQIKGALIYPTMLVLICIVIIIVLLKVVVPKIVNQFIDMGHSLPGSTQFLIDASDFINQYGVYLLIGILATIAGFKRALGNESFKYKYHKFLLSLFGVKRLIRGANAARFAKTLSILTASAVPLLDAMKIAAEVLDNVYIKDQVGQAADKVREGTSLRAALQQTKLFPPMMLHMIASGEKSGQLEHMLDKAADNQDRELDSLINVSLKALEPTIMLSMGGIVLFIVLAVMMPIIELNNLVAG
ncbi:type II secretion system inner membrane protein GspF [Thalassotalea agarivorans]|uniref:Type II secretion system protein F (GspF) n=1 Tax=Thalassotalea agarivorans TaxID=349064 RepID=A0A1I0E436_THASX|nr:type II secretion system inner membrane protein GspF [Thalassotalea agarivorans]SET39734.1 type II secretion system protein F (GspF) [Thalassotalea agarivorans]